MSDQTEHLDPQLAKALNRLTPEQLAEVSPKLQRETYAPGEVIVAQDAPGNRFYIVTSGEAEVYYAGEQGQARLIDRRLPGEYFGEIALLRDTPRTATVRAWSESEVVVLAMDRDDFQQLITDSKATGAFVAQDMVQRLITLANAHR